MLPESVPPEPTRGPDPPPAPAPAPDSVAPMAQATVREQEQQEEEQEQEQEQEQQRQVDVTPSLGLTGWGAQAIEAQSSSLLEVSAFMAEQLKQQLHQQREHDQRMRQELKAERRELEDKLAQRDAQAKADRESMLSEVEELRASKLRDIQVVALQIRLEALHAAKLLQDDERDAVEDIVADGIGTDLSIGRRDVVAELLALSTQMVSDRSFARQLRRKYTGA